MKQPVRKKTQKKTPAQKAKIHLESLSLLAWYQHQIRLSNPERPSSTP